MTTIRILRHAVASGYRDYAVIYTWKTWLAGWYVRVLAQVIFFALIGKLLGSQARVEYLLVGNAVMLAAVGGLFGVAGTTWERRAGTLPLLIASPSSSVVVFAGRSAWGLTEGILSSAGTFYVAAPLFGLELEPRSLLVLPVLVLVASSAYALGIFLGGLVLRAMSTRNVVANIASATMMAICGVNVPLAFWPGPVQWLAHALPLTHGLQAIRGLLAGEGAAAILPNVALEALVGLGWLGAALLTFNRLAESGRRDGSIEFAS